MPAWLLSLITDLVIRLASWAYGKGKEAWDEDKAEDEIDKKLARLKAAKKAAFDGTPVTKEQRDELRKAISDFLRSDNGGV